MPSNKTKKDDSILRVADKHKVYFDENLNETRNVVGAQDVVDSKDGKISTIFWIILVSIVVLIVGITAADYLSVDGLSSDTGDLRFIYYPDESSSGNEIVFGDLESLTSSGFKANAQTIIIIDGFLSNINTPMSQETKSGFVLKHSSANVIVLDWGHLSGSKTTLENAVKTGILYTKVLANVGPVGSRVAEFLNFLKVNKNIELTDVYIVGHSLGAQIAGAAGLHVQKKYGVTVARITGLDPAGPFFSDQTNMDKRLDSSDAKFVDIYHTNRVSLGDSALQTEQRGHINVFVNGGASQPGCEKTDDSESELQAGICSHSFSWKFFNSAFDINYTACPCDDTACLCADCDLTCDSPITLGYKTPTTAGGKYYVKTAAIP